MTDTCCPNAVLRYTEADRAVAESLVNAVIPQWPSCLCHNEFSHLVAQIAAAIYAARVTA